MINKYKDTLLLLLCAMLWGLSYPIQTVMATYFTTATIIMLKGLGGVFLIFVIVVLKIKINKKTIISGILLGIVCYVGLYLQQRALETTTVSKTSFICSLYIVFVPLISILFKKKPNKRVWLSVVIAVLGMYFLCGNSDLKFGLGEIYALSSALMFAVQIILTGKYAQDCDAISLTCVQDIGIVLSSLPFVLTKETINLSSVTPIIPHILFTLFISGAVSQVLQIKCQGRLDPSLASLIMSMESVFGALCGWLILSQSLSLLEIFGCILIFISILLAE